MNDTEANVSVITLSSIVITPQRVKPGKNSGKTIETSTKIEHNNNCVLRGELGVSYRTPLY